jgi:hypothetical protein
MLRCTKISGKPAKILIMGLPGSGKTTLARALASRLQAVHFNADEVRANINKDLGFSVEDRIEHARRMGWLCDKVSEAGGAVIADFVCPTVHTREAFGDAFVIWVDRIKEGRFADTNNLFVPPEKCDLHLVAGISADEWAAQACSALMAWRSFAAAPEPRSAVAEYLTRLGSTLKIMELVARIKHFVGPGALHSPVKTLCSTLVRSAVGIMLCAVIMALRASFDVAAFREWGALVQMCFTLQAFFWGGSTAAILSIFSCLGLDYFMIEPVFSLGVTSDAGLIYFSIASLISMIIGIMASGAFWRMSRSLLNLEPESLLIHRQIQDDRG